MDSVQIEYRGFIVAPEGYHDSPWFVISKANGKSFYNPDGMQITSDVIYTENANIEYVFRYIDRVYFGGYGGI